MNEAEIDIIARINFMEFLLETIFAQSHAQVSSPEKFEKWRRDLLHLIRDKAVIGSNDPQNVGAIVHNRLVGVAETFCQRVESRMNEVAAATALQAQKTPTEYDN